MRVEVVDLLLHATVDPPPGEPPVEPVPHQSPPEHPLVPLERVLQHPLHPDPLSPDLPYQLVVFQPGRELLDWLLIFNITIIKTVCQFFQLYPQTVASVLST